MSKYTLDDDTSFDVEMQLLEDFGQPIWKVSWSVTGGVLAVSDSSGTVTLWKETADGKWQKISRAQQ